MFFINVCGYIIYNTPLNNDIAIGFLRLLKTTWVDKKTYFC